MSKIGRPKSKNPKNIDIKIRIDEKLNNEILKFCNENNIIRTELIRRSVKSYLYYEKRRIRKMNDAVKGLVKALVLIKDHDGGFEKNRYVDEWTKAESFDECKKKLLKML